MGFKYKKIPSFVKRDGNALLFNNAGIFKFYVPDLFFERKMAEIEGEYVNMMGIANYTIETDGKNNGLHTFFYPSVFRTKPGRIETIKGVKLTKNSQADDYKVLSYEKDDEIVCSVMTAKAVSNADILLGMFMTGKLPTTIDYDKIYNYFLKNIDLNGEDYKLNAQLFGIIVSEMCRDPKDINTLFRHTDMKDMTNYQYINMKEIPKHISPFTSITSENIDESIINATLTKPGQYSPLEKILI